MSDLREHFRCDVIRSTADSSVKKILASVKLYTKLCVINKITSDKVQKSHQNILEYNLLTLI